MKKINLMTAKEAARLVQAGQRALIAGCGAEPRAVLAAVAQDPELWRDVRLTGAWIPGVNDGNFAGLGRNTLAETIFTTAGLKGQAGTNHLPLHYSSYWQWLSRAGVVDVIYLRCPPPAADGTVGLGIASDFSLAAISAGAKLVGLISPEMPDLAGTPRLPVERFASFVEDDCPLIEYDAGTIDPATTALAQNILSLLREGDTLQLGLGKVQAAVLQEIGQSGLCGLGFHAGMISSPMQPALEQNIFSRGVTSGVALGSHGFYAALKDHKINWRTVGETHAAGTLSAIENFVSVNSVLEVDFWGQANAEMMKGAQISGQGGLVDFLRGARAAKGGRAILALGATAGGGKISRIVPRLTDQAATTVARADVDYVVTEFGIAKLAELGLSERAEALISIAAPQHRDFLANSIR